MRIGDWSSDVCSSYLVELFAGAGDLDRLAGDRAHRERRTTARIAVEPGEHDAGERHVLGEACRDVDRILAGQGIDDEKDFGGIGDVGEIGRASCRERVCQYV